MKLKTLLSTLLCIFSIPCGIALGGGVMVGSGNSVVFRNGIKLDLPENWSVVSGNHEYKVTSDIESYNSTVAFDLERKNDGLGRGRISVAPQTDFKVTKYIHLEELVVTVLTDANSSEGYTQKIYLVHDYDSAQKLVISAIFGSQQDEAHFENKLSTLEDTN